MSVKPICCESMAPVKSVFILWTRIESESGLKYEGFFKLLTVKENELHIGRHVGVKVKLWTEDDIVDGFNEHEKFVIPVLQIGVTFALMLAIYEGINNWILPLEGILFLKSIFTFKLKLLSNMFELLFMIEINVPGVAW